MRFSRTRLTDVLHRRHSARPAPWPVGSWRDDGSVEGDQPEAVRGLSQDPVAVSLVLLVALGDEARQVPVGVEHDLGEEPGGVPVSEVARPAAQELVEVVHDHLDGNLQPRAVGDLPNPLAGSSHRLPRGPAGDEGAIPAPARVGALANPLGGSSPPLPRGPADEEGEMPGPRSVTAHVAMMEAEEINAL